MRGAVGGRVTFRYIIHVINEHSPVEGRGTKQRVRAPVGLSDKSSEGENTRDKGEENRMSKMEN